MTNKYGLDVNYFREKLNLIVRDLDSYTPAELKSDLFRLAMTAGSKDPDGKLITRKPDHPPVRIMDGTTDGVYPQFTQEYVRNVNWDIAEVEEKFYKAWDALTNKAKKEEN